MSNMIEKAKSVIAKAMAYRFPKYPVCFENVEDDSRILGLGVFAVPSCDFVSVQDYVFDLESSGVLPEGWELLPLVRDPVATRMYYPDIVVPWSVATLYGIASCITEITGYVSPAKRAPVSMEDVLRSAELSTIKWEREPTACARAHEQITPRQDLALAA